MSFQIEDWLKAIETNAIFIKKNTSEYSAEHDRACLIHRAVDKIRLLLPPTPSDQQDDMKTKVTEIHQMLVEMSVKKEPPAQQHLWKTLVEKATKPCYIELSQENGKWKSGFWAPGQGGVHPSDTYETQGEARQAMLRRLDRLGIRDSVAYTLS